MEHHFDYIVVGAGSAGAAVAARLSEDGKRRVALVEAGDEDRNIWIHIPLGVGKLLTDERWVWPYRSAPQEHLAGQGIYSPRGRVLGGSSSVNGMAYVWGDPAIFDRWAQNGLHGWAWADVVPWFRQLENVDFNADPRRGHDGPVRITDLGARDPDPLSDAFIGGCLGAGIPATADYNADNYEGARYLEQTAWRGRRWSTARGYLKEARKRSNLMVFTKARAGRILFDGRRARGVECRTPAGNLVLRASREVVLSAGAIMSPHLLELSGIGDGARLGGFGIDTVHHNPAVGEHLSDHLQVRRTYQTTLPRTINDLMRSPVLKVMAGLRYMLARKGLLAGTSSTAHAIARTEPGRPHPDVMIRLYQISGKDRYSRDSGGGIDRFSGFSLGGFQLEPRSRGSVHLASPDPDAVPVLQPNYFADPEDAAVAVRILRLVDRVARDPAMAPVIVQEHLPGPGHDDDEALLDYAKRTGQTAWHTVGSCRMGAPGASVVDTRFRVHGIEGLRVIDASVFPEIPSSNTNAAAIMAGERGAAFIAEDEKAGPIS